jgi:hypothetical protein
VPAGLRNQGPLQRARIVPRDGSTPLECHYNPSTMTLAKSARWKFDRNRNAPVVAPPEFIGSDPQVLTTDLLFDAFEGSSRSVVKAVDRLISWTCPTRESRDRNTPQPPLLVLHWGEQTYGPGFLKSVSVKYSLFDASGEPLRATASISISEVPVTPPGTNPTSGGGPGRRSAVTQAGDTLAALAYREYGDPNLWRAIAEVNGIDDPSRIPAGTALLVPPLAEAGRLSAVAGA